MHLLYKAMSIILTFLFLVILFACSPSYDDPLDVADAFATALLENDLDKAKALSSSDNWKRLDHWIADHVPFKCPGLDYDSGTTSGGSYSDTTEKWTMHVSKRCANPGNVHCFEVNNIELSQVGEEWKVLDGEVECEVNDFCYACP